MKKKIFAIVMLTVCACLTFTSCKFFGGNDSSESLDNSSTTAPNSQSEELIVDESFEDIELPEIDIERP